MTANRHPLEERLIGQDVVDLCPQGFCGIVGSMIENKPGFAIANKIMEAIEIGNEHGATMRHCFERREPKRFTAFRQGRVNK